MGQATHSQKSALSARKHEPSLAPPTAFKRLESELGELARFLVGALAHDLRAPRGKP